MLGLVSELRVKNGGCVMFWSVVIILPRGPDLRHSFFYTSAELEPVCLPRNQFFGCGTGLRSGTGFKLAPGLPQWERGIIVLSDICGIGCVLTTSSDVKSMKPGKIKKSLKDKENTKSCGNTHNLGLKGLKHINAALK